MTIMGAGAAIALLLVQAGAATLPVDATAAGADDDKYTFFSQPAATRAQVAADWDECRELASTVQPPRAGYMYTPNLIAAGVGGFIQGMQRGAQRRHMADAALRKCMNIKGYDRFAMTKEDAKALYGGPGGWPGMRERLTDRALAPVGAAQKVAW